MIQQKTEYLKLKMGLGSVSVAVGLLAVIFSALSWSELVKPHYLLGTFAGYIFVYGSLGSIILGSLLMNDFRVIRRKLSIKSFQASTEPTSMEFLVNLEKEEAKVTQDQ